MTLKHFTVLMYLQKFFAEFNPIYPLYALMFIEHGGLTTQDVSLLFLIWFTTAFLSEIPTGIVADKISRRYSSLIGRILLMGTFVAWFLSPTFIGFAIGFVLWGIGFAFTSGATDSYLFDMLKKLGAQHEFTKLYSRTTSVKIFGMFCAYTLAIVLIPFGYQNMLLVSIAVSTIVPVILLLMPHDSMEHMKHRSHISILKEAVQTLQSSKIFLILGTFLMFIGGMIGVLEEYIPLYYAWNGFETEFITIMLTVGLLGATVLQWHAHYFDKYKQRVLFILVAFAGLILFSTSFFYGWIAVIGIYIFIELTILTQTSLTGRIHTMFETDARSTVMSLITFVVGIIAIVVTGILLLLQMSFSDTFSIAVLGLIVFAVGIFFTISKVLTTE